MTTHIALGAISIQAPVGQAQQIPRRYASTAHEEVNTPTFRPPLSGGPLPPSK